MIRSSIQVQFGAGSSGNEHVSIEIDDRQYGLNAGKTNFIPGDTAWLLIHKSSNVTIDQILLSAGSVVLPSVTVGVVQKQEDITFDDADTASLAVPATGLVECIWLGNQLGSISLKDDGITLRTERKGVAVARIKYNTTPIARGIRSPTNVGNVGVGVVDFPINIVIKATAT